MRRNLYTSDMPDQMFDSTISSLPKITILDDNTANQIAAGEVIERPASVVKELVENAVDAGARRITVELIGSGKRSIRVTDDGCGMSQEDAILSLQRHATSKIRSANDLAEILTMGFRGEALPSIASVARVTIATHLADARGDSPGTEILLTGGRIDDVREIGARSGTSITVEDLFYNVPARLKFLKTDSTELHHILELIQRQAMAHPETAFRLTHNNQEIFASSGSGSLQEVCREVYGRQVARQLLEIDYATGMGVRVRGMLGTPETLRGSRAGQHTFVNNRFVRDRAISRALEEGYRAVQTIHGQQYPVAVILVEIDPASVDVNVSPTKTEVRFLREREVFSAVYRAVQQTLIDKGGLAPSVAAHPVQSSEIPPAPNPQTQFSPIWRDPFERKAAPDRFEYAPNQAEAHRGGPVADPFEDQVSEPAAYTTQEEYAAEKASYEQYGTCSPHGDGAEHRKTLTDLHVLAQTRNMYILAQTGQSLVLIDQHIAHERILYERLLKGQADSALAVQHLVIPLTLDLGRREALVVGERLEQLPRAGFVLEPFGAGTFIVRAAPAAVCQKQSVERVVRAIIDELVEKTVSRRLVVPAEEVLITASCKMAVKAGDPLTDSEMRALIADLLKCDNPYTCPHGRPIMIEIANRDLDRKFGRI